MLLHCDKCHHEFEGLKGDKRTWCGASSYVLMEKTGFELLEEINAAGGMRFGTYHNFPLNKRS